MTARLGWRAEQRRNIDVNMIGADSIAAQSKHVGKGKSCDRAIYPRVSDFSLTTGSFICAPALQQQMLAGFYCRKESRHRSRYGVPSHCLGRIAESKSRIRCQQLNEGWRVCRVDGRKQSVPPRRIEHGHLIINHGFSIRRSRRRSRHIRG
jgi:hypothetical protein